jgi:hypothetical protein
MVPDAHNSYQVVDHSDHQVEDEEEEVAQVF